jgi:hypothetical protein
VILRAVEVNDDSIITDHKKAYPYCGLILPVTATKYFYENCLPVDHKKQN